MKIYSHTDSNDETAKTKHIVLFYEHISREVDAAVRIADTLLHHSVGNTEVVLAQINLEWPDVLQYARRNGIDAVMVPSCYATIPDCLWTMPLKRLNKDLVIVNFHHEQIPAPFNEHVQLPHDAGAKNGCMHIAWSDVFRENLIKVGVNEELICVTGNPRADLLLDEIGDPTREQLAKKYQLDDSKQWIIFCENRYASAAEAINNREKNTLYREIDKDVFSRKERLDEESRKLLFEQINKLSKDFFDKYEFIYRPHPGIEAKYDFADEVHVIQDGSIGTWLKAVDLALVWNSTTAFEADALGVPVARHEPIPNDEQFQSRGLGSYPCIQDLDTIDDNLIAKIRKENEQAKNYKLNYGSVDGKSFSRIANALLEAIDNPPPLHNPTMPLKEYVIFSLRNRLANCFWKWGWLEKLKWPKAGYIHRAEIID